MERLGGPALSEKVCHPVWALTIYSLTLFLVFCLWFLGAGRMQPSSFQLEVPVVMPSSPL